MFPLHLLGIANTTCTEFLISFKYVVKGNLVAILWFMVECSVIIIYICVVFVSDQTETQEEKGVM